MYATVKMEPFGRQMGIVSLVSLILPYFRLFVNSFCNIILPFLFRYLPYRVCMRRIFIGGRNR